MQPVPPSNRTDASSPSAPSATLPSAPPGSFRAHLERAGWDFFVSLAFPVGIVIGASLFEPPARPLGVPFLLMVGSTTLANLGILYVRSRYGPPGPGWSKAGAVAASEPLPGRARLGVQALVCLHMLAWFLFAEHVFISDDGLTAPRVGFWCAMIAFAFVVSVVIVELKHEGTSYPKARPTSSRDDEPERAR